MKITLDFDNFWQEWKETLKYTYQVWTDPKIAPPSIRGFDVGFVTLLDENQRDVGCFVPELYELAKIGGLRAQQQEKAWKQKNPLAEFQKKKEQPFFQELYHGDDTPKTPFALSVLGEIYSDQDKHCTRKIQKHLEREFNYRIARNQPLPPIVFKYQIQADYLKNLNFLHLTVGNARSLKINILNPHQRTTLAERISHYLAQRAALMLTLMAVLSITITNPYLFASTALLMILGKWCNEEFATYGLTETLLREIRSNFAKEFRWGDRISLKKTIKTMILIFALGFGAYFAFAGTWANVTSYALWHATTNHFLLISKYLFAGLASMLAATSVFVSGTIAQRYFWGLGIWDKQIDFTKEKPCAPCQHKNFETKLKKWQQKFQGALKKKLCASHFSESYEKSLFYFKHLQELYEVPTTHEANTNSINRSTMGLNGV